MSVRNVVMAVVAAAVVLATAVRIGMSLGANANTTAPARGPQASTERARRVGEESPFVARVLSADEPSTPRVDGGITEGVVVDDYRETVEATEPEVLREAEGVVSAALARRTLTTADRARLVTLLPQIATTDRIALANAITEASRSGRLVIEGASTR